DGTNQYQADITIVADAVVTCTYVNKQQLGAIKITKTSVKPGGSPLAGAVFAIKDSGGHAITGSPFTTPANGTVCGHHLPFGDYTVTETAAPTGYAIDDGTGETVTIDKNSTCGDGNEATKSFTDSPLTDILAKAHSEVAGGTQSTVTCVDASN